MKQLIWNEGLSVGVKRIDDEHKKIIIILEQLIQAIDNECSTEQIEQAFTELENYTLYHFSYEEKFMAEIGYKNLEEHKKSHQEFIKTITNIKAQLLTDGSREVAEDISFYLYHWIVTHIIEEDMNYITETKNRSSKPKQKSSLFKSLSTWFSQHFKLTSRIFIITVFPIFTMVMLSYVVLSDNYKKYNNAVSLMGVNEIISKVNNLNHQLQLERGLANGYVGSKYIDFKDELVQQQTLSDQAIIALKDTLNEQDHLRILPYTKAFNEKYAQIKLIRHQLTLNQADLASVNELYNSAIEQLLLKVNSLTHIDIESDFVNEIIAIGTILRLKEITGQLRAIGTSLIGLSVTDITHHNKINHLSGKQLELLRLFKLSASEDQKAMCSQLCDKLFINNLSEEEFTKGFNVEFMSYNSKAWFKVMTGKMDSLKVIVDKMIENLNIKTQQKVTELYQKYLIIISILAVTLLLTLLLSVVVYHSIIAPIRRVTQALNRITLGHKGRHIITPLANDEINELFESYEKLRRKLIQADIIQGENDYQKTLLTHRKKQKEHFKELAYKDPLTGAYNRRSLTRILSQEITEANNTSSSLSLMALDIDFFKVINDNFGHNAGDIALKSFYQACFDAVRVNDYVIRTGGEEFIILLPNTPIEQATNFAQRLKEIIANLVIDAEQNKITLTVSIGVSQWDKVKFTDSNEFINQADQRLYKAKHSGRNCVVAS